VLKDLPPITYTEMFYDLSPAHLKLYQQLASEQLKVLENGDKIDITNVSALFNALQQIPANAEHFSGGEVDSTVFDLIDEVMEELGDDKLVLFTRYRMTNKRVLEKCAKYGVLAIYGEISSKQQQQAIDTFVNDSSCRMIALQVEAAGFGIDKLQDVCKDALFIELPYTAAAFEQAEARLHRSGQKGNVNIRIALAEKTIQNYIWQMVQGKSALVNLCIRGSTALQDSVFGVTNGPGNLSPCASPDKLAARFISSAFARFAMKSWVASLATQCDFGQLRSTPNLGYFPG
jgi:SNF2 family DNA or RNA helicase